MAEDNGLLPKDFWDVGIRHEPMDADDGPALTLESRDGCWTLDIHGTDPLPHKWRWKLYKKSGSGLDYIMAHGAADDTRTAIRDAEKAARKQIEGERG